MSVEVPCTKCGNAAVELTPPALTAAVRLIAGKIAKMLGAGAELDPEAPIIGMTAEQFAQVFGVKCIACVDADLQKQGGYVALEETPPPMETAPSSPDTPQGSDIIEATYDAAAN